MSTAEITPPAIGVEAVREAATRLAPWIHRTPVMTSRTLDERCGGSVFLKCENFQKIGAFKIRGAMNALLRLGEEERARGVVTHSSGNHAQALAQAGRWLGVPVCVVMPNIAPAPKKAATAGYGARIIECEPTLAAREGAVAEIIEREGSTLVHPFDNWDVIAGQGTAAWELMDQAGPLDVILCPVGGGGLLAGTALATKGRSPSTRVVGGEPARADDALRSFVSGRIEPSGDPRTVADGLRTSLGVRPFSIIRRDVDQIVTATEAEILDAMRFVWERFKIIIEPSCAVPVAPVYNGQLPVEGLRVGIIITGGNVDLEPFFQSLAAKWL
ncbi:pyridoxal-phosphate dependent enzyme [Tundrisphaera sp. TA3]|uniref:pyridoxal-phosphate dependent enzyme n=1 Tax=Tundrisphaera sp. TA3 TaxID=3435775 RepID=UPI003EBD7F26